MKIQACINIYLTTSQVLVQQQTMKLWIHAVEKKMTDILHLRPCSFHFPWQWWQLEWSVHALQGRLGAATRITAEKIILVVAIVVDVVDVPKNSQSCLYNLQRAISGLMSWSAPR